MLHFPTPGYSSLFRWGKDSFFSKQGSKSAAVFLKEFMAQRRATGGKGYISVPSGNHDMDRLAQGRDAEDLKVCLAFLMTLPGVPFLYYGDEIGMDKVMGLPSKEGGYFRTGSRTPMQWNKGANKGFSKAAAAKLYLPVDTKPSAPGRGGPGRQAGILAGSLARQPLALRRREPPRRSRTPTSLSCFTMAVRDSPWLICAPKARRGSWS